MQLSFTLSKQDMQLYLNLLRENDESFRLGEGMFSFVMTWKIARGILTLVVILFFTIRYWSAFWFQGLTIIFVLIIPSLLIQIALQKREAGKGGAYQRLPTQMTITDDGITVIRMNKTGVHKKSTIFVPWEMIEDFFIASDFLIIHFCTVTCNIGFHFEDNLKKIELFREDCEDTSRSYEEFQVALKRAFGRPNVRTKNADGSESCEWDICGEVKIYHYIANRFGLAEYLFIERI